MLSHCIALSHKIIFHRRGAQKVRTFGSFQVLKFIIVNSNVTND